MLSYSFAQVRSTRPAKGQSCTARAWVGRVGWEGSWEWTLQLYVFCGECLAGPPSLCLATYLRRSGIILHCVVHWLDRVPIGGQGHRT